MVEYLKTSFSFLSEDTEKRYPRLDLIRNISLPLKLGPKRKRRSWTGPFQSQQLGLSEVTGQSVSGRQSVVGDWGQYLLLQHSKTLSRGKGGEPKLFFSCKLYNIHPNWYSPMSFLRFESWIYLLKLSSIPPFHTYWESFCMLIQRN